MFDPNMTKTHVFVQYYGACVRACVRMHACMYVCMNHASHTR